MKEKYVITTYIDGEFQSYFAYNSKESAINALSNTIKEFISFYANEKINIIYQNDGDNINVNIEHDYFKEVISVNIED